jgi:hypothetical protein
MNELHPTIKFVLGRASRRLLESVNYWWPAQGNNDISEAMYVMHFSNALQQSGWLTYAEVQVGNTPSEHIDLIAVHKERQWIIETEAKQLYSSEKARKLGEQWTCLKESTLPSEYGERPLPTFPRYWCLLAICWKQKQAILDWWRGDLMNDAPRGTQNPVDWIELRQALTEAKNHGIKDTISVHCKDEAWFLYALAPL